MSEQTDKNLPLQGLKVIEMGQLIARSVGLTSMPGSCSANSAPM